MAILLTDDVSVTIEPGMILDSAPRLTLDGCICTKKWHGQRVQEPISKRSAKPSFPTTTIDAKQAIESKRVHRVTHPLNLHPDLAVSRAGCGSPG
jgi:hypothetical protein